jgi:pimeloyl-ACP methyl ester carboxylesterase
VGLRGTAIVLAAAVAAAAFSGSAQAQGTPCGTTPGLLCSTVTVPLDRSGVVPGTVSLHVEELPATGQPRGAVFLIAGGPGQGSARAFSLGTPDEALLFRFLFPGYTLVAYDDRGTGDSGLLNCPALQVSTAPTGEDVLASACATQIGPAA